jgi:tetratricopeptide (TPR) repeat protein
MTTFIRYTEDARRTIVGAKHEADRFGSLEIDPEHILLALLNDLVLISRTMEQACEKEIRETLNTHLPRREPNPLPHDLPLSGAASEALASAEAEADKFGHRYIRNEHLLLGLVEHGDSYAGELLKKQGLSTEELRLQIKASPQTMDVQGSTRKSNRPPAEIELIRRVQQFVFMKNCQSALRLLNDYMAESGEDRKLRMRSLGGFAANTAIQLGDLNAVQRYCEESLAYTPDDPMALYTLADCLDRQGKVEDARQHAADCRRAALSQGEEFGKIMVKLVETRFPDFKMAP